jgi:hypothetical protein
MKTRQYTYLQGSLHATFSELLAAFGKPIWQCDKEICRFKVGDSGAIYMRLGWPVPLENELESVAAANSEWAISGSSGEILAEISDILGITPAQHWRISAKN